MKILINHVYWTPVGHVLEALKMSKGFYNANKNIEIHVALNKETTYELAKACPWIKKYYAVDTKDILKHGVKAKSFKAIPKKWDYVLHDFRILNEVAGKNKLWSIEKAYVNYYKLTQKVFDVKWQGNIWEKNKYPKELKYKPRSKIDLNLPKKSLSFVRKKYDHKDPKICMMLGGSAGYAYYPSIKTWIKIIKLLNKEIPNLKIYLTGVSESKKGRTHTQAYTNKNIEQLKKLDNVVDCYDIGLWNQLALLKMCNVFISPHTGFAFLVPCVNTPWLAISGGDWPEYFFNDIPFYSVFPDDKKYPYVGKGKYSKHTGNFSGKWGKIPHMNPKNLDKKISEIIKYTKILIDKKLTYKESVKLHVKNIKKKGFDIRNFGALDDALGLNKFKEKLK